MEKYRILFGYPYYACSETYGDSEKVALTYLERLKIEGFNVEGFCLTLNPPGPCLSFKDLDARWKRGDKELLYMYEKLERAIEGKDIFINAAGINLHPEFVAKLPIYTVFQCFDDPENSNNLSKPVAASYDLSLVGNIAEVNTYRDWGVKNAEWIPLGLQPNIYDSNMTYNQILEENRDIDVFMMIDRSVSLRKERLDKIADAFPNAHFYGKGWDRGYLQNGKEVDYLKRAKIGLNIHNSTGPINYRTFYLPANGVLQICDNKSFLSKIFKLNEEVIGFDTIEECIYLCKYYLEHDNERRVIAANGWKRVMTDYNEVNVFRKTLSIIEKYMSVSNRNEMVNGIALGQIKKTKYKRIIFSYIYNPIYKLAYRIYEHIFKPKKVL